MTIMFTHMYRVRAILALLLFLSSASLWAQSDDATLINITTFAQLDAIHHDLDGDGTPSGNTTEQAAYRTAFGLGAGVNNTCTGGCEGYELRNNLDFAGTKWENPTGGTFSGTHETGGWDPIGGSFAATFDGRGHTISNLYINRSSSRVGLFGRLASGGNVRNLGIEGGSLSGADYVGGLVGWSSGTISACYATGDANGTSWVGGLVGNSGGTISACHTTGDATGTGDNVGGLVGQANGQINACYATGDVTGSGVVGGLVGNNSGATISACYATGTVTGSGDEVGGLVGVSSGTISACYATGDVTGSGDHVGGLLGRNEDTISACYATGNATGTGKNVGGLVGRNPAAGTISACYSTGDATSSSGSSNVGGLVGRDTGAITNSYFDSDTSNRLDTDDYAKTTTELQTPTAYGTGIYVNWNIDVDNGQPIGVEDGTAIGDAAADDPWDFGTDSEYPALRVDFNANGTSTAFEFAGQGRAVPATVPDAPTALMATAANTEVTLSWTAAASDGAPVTSYMIDYSLMADFASSTTATIMAAATSYTASGLTNGTLYYFRVAAVNVAGTSAYHPGVGGTAVSATPAPTVPSAPSALTATAADAAVTLNWTPPSDNGGSAIANYMVDYSLSADFSSSTTATTMGAATSYTASSLVNGTLYYFRVAAVNAVGTSAYYPGTTGTAVSATPAVPPLAISSISPTSGAVGETVMITGTSFSSTATEDSISFGGSPYVVASSFIADTRIGLSPIIDTLVVTVPSAAQTGKISVKVLSGTPAMSTVDFTVLTSVPPTDMDADGLIDITTLAQLDAIRYDLDGDGRPTSAGQTAWQTAFSAVAASDDDVVVRDASTGFTGYELMNDLDFEDANGNGTADDKSIWAEGASGAGISGAVAEGWATIGDNNTDSNESRFTATFDGNNNVISNLYIDRPTTNNVGLFGVLGSGGNIRNLGIEGGSVTGGKNVGGLVGRNFGASTISACYATGDASGSSLVGGLVGQNLGGTISACYATGNATGTADNVGGLVGRNSGAISACYATGNASGTRRVGGLVGANNATISACYATGNATGTADNVGGLVGENSGTGTISACYSTGDANGSSDVGGLVGKDDGTVTNSYFDSSVSNRTSSDSYDKTTTELQTPTAYGTAMDIYANWNIDVDNGQPIGVENGTATGDAAADDPWEFGTNVQYPALQVDFDRNGTPSVVEFGTQPRTAPTVPDAPTALTATAADAAVTLNWTAPVNNGGATIINYMIGYDTDMNFSSPPTTATTMGAATSYTASSLTNGTLYYFRVAAVNSAGRGAYHPGTTGTAVSATPAPPVVSSFTPTSGAVGETVMIWGTGFSSTATEDSISFGGSPYVVASSFIADTRIGVSPIIDTLVVTVPSAAQTGKISVKVLNGTPALSTVDFTVLTLVPPTDMDADGLIDITTLAQLDAIRYDLDGNGVVSFTTAASLPGSPMFSNRTAVVTLMGADSIYAQAFTSGDFYATAAATTAATGAVAASTIYYYKLSSAATSPYTGYELMNNLDFAGTKWENPTGGTFTGTHETGGWVPIGNSSSFAARFTAAFDGNNNVISNLYINRSSTDDVGLFGYVGINENGTTHTTADDQVGEIRNLGLEEGSVTGEGNVGSLVGAIDGPVSGCYSTLAVSGNYNVGGLLGWFVGDPAGSKKISVIGCYATGAVTGVGSSVEEIGGLVGYSDGVGDISACYSTGDVSSSNSYSGMGGLVGGTRGLISACYSTGDVSGSVSGSGGMNIGGLVGKTDDEVNASYATGDVTGRLRVGGLVGYNDSGTISACYSRGDANGSSDVGGLVGNNEGTVTNSYFDSSVSNRTSSDSYDKTTTELQTPTAYAGIYANWNIDVDDSQLIGVENGTAAGDAAADDPWEFGTDSEYPALQVDFDRNGTPSVVEFGTQPRAAPPATVPDAPTALTATAADAAVTLNWTAPVNNGGATIINYMIDYSVNADLSSSMTVSTAGAVTSYIVSSLTNGTLYYFRVAAVNSAGRGAYHPGTTGTAVSATPAPPVVSSFTPTSGAVGETVMIWGTGFSSTATEDSISFGGSPYVVASSFIADTRTGVSPIIDTLVVNVPSAAQTGKISVKVLNGTPALSTVDFTVLTSVPPTDMDADGLIDITTLAQLDAIRYDLDGDGRPTSAGQTAWQTAFSAVAASDDDAAVRDASTGFTGYELMNDLDFEDANGNGTADDKSIWAEGASGAGVSGAVAEGWAPIGDNSTNSDATRFTATFDGRGHTISNLYIDRPSTSYVGLFGALGTGGNVRNLGIEGGSVTGDAYVGGLVGNNLGTIRACYATVNVTASQNDVGGLVGDNFGTISACYATGNASGSGFVGGLVGYNRVTISACYATGDATGTGSDVGGLVGA